MGIMKLKRMNRFELLEVMYRLSLEKEALKKRCIQLEAQLEYKKKLEANLPEKCEGETEEA